MYDERLNPDPGPIFYLTIVLIICAVLALGLLVAGASATGPTAAELERVDAWGFPGVAPLEQGELLVDFDGRTRVPRIVMERLTARTAAGGADRTDQWDEDERIPIEFRPRLRDYVGTGFDRGHLAPAADFGGLRAKGATFSTLNLCPQDAQLNRGLWRTLEEHVRGLAVEGAILWVATVPLYLPIETKEGREVRYAVIGASEIGVPTHLGKSVLTLAAGERLPSRLVAWIIPNRDPGTAIALERYRVSVDELERAAGLDLWADLPYGLERKLEAAK